MAHPTAPLMLAEHDVHVGVHRIKRLRKKLGIRCKQNRKFKATTDSKHALPVASNLLKQEFVASAPGQVWLSDITYIWTDQGWLYLAGHRDIFAGEIVGYAFGQRMTKELVERSLFRAVATKSPPRGLIHHSDCNFLYSLVQEVAQAVWHEGIHV